MKRLKFGNNKAFGEENAEVGKVLDKVAQMKAAKYDVETAISLWEQSLSILESTLGPEHIEVAIVLSNYSELYRKEAEVVVQTEDKEYAVESARVTREKARLKAAVPEELISRREYQEAQLEAERTRVAHENAVADLEAFREASTREIDILRIEAGFFLFTNECRISPSISELGLSALLGDRMGSPEIKLVAFEVL